MRRKEYQIYLQVNSMARAEKIVDLCTRNGREAVLVDLTYLPEQPAIFIAYDPA